MVRRLILSFMLLAVASPVLVRAADPEQVVFVFQRQKDPSKVQADADRVAEHLSKAIGKPVKAVVPGDYSATVQALRSEQAEFAYVSSLPFLLARRDAGATLLLAEERPDVANGSARTDYDSILVVAADSPLQSLDQLVARAKDLRFCFTSTTSSSGYIIPYAAFVERGLLEPKQDVRRAFRSVAFGGGYTQALQEVLAGRADVAAVSDYVMDGPRKDVYLDAEQRSKLRVLARLPGVPTHVICARGGLSEELKTKVRDALVKLSTEQPELLASVYGASKLVVVDEAKHVQPVIKAVEAIGLPIDGLAK